LPCLGVPTSKDKMPASGTVNGQYFEPSREPTLAHFSSGSAAREGNGRFSALGDLFVARCQTTCLG
jgi:hypothetical protein